MSVLYVEQKVVDFVLYIEHVIVIYYLTIVYLHISII